MKLSGIILFLLCLFLFSVACNKNGKVDAEKESIAPKWETVKITLKRTQCYGTCPVYDVTIQGNGAVNYSGKNHVKVTGEKAHKISEKDVKKLVEAFYAADYFNLEDAYRAKARVSSDGNSTQMKLDAPTTDLPSTITSITIDGKAKTITNIVNAPQALVDLEKMIDEIAGTKAYIGG